MIKTPRAPHLVAAQLPRPHQPVERGAADAQEVHRFLEGQQRRLLYGAVRCGRRGAPVAHGWSLLAGERWGCASAPSTAESNPLGRQRLWRAIAVYYPTASC